MANLRHCLRFPSLLSFLDFLRCSWSSSVATGFPALDQSVRQGALSIPGLFDAIGLFTVEELVETEKARFIVVGFDFATILLYPSCSCILFAIVLVQLVKLKILSAAERAEMADVKQMKKIVPLIACEIPFCQYDCKLVFGVDILDLKLGVQIDSVRQPIKSNSVGSGNMSHCWTSAFDDHFNHGFVILKDVQHRTKSRKLCVRRHTVNIVQIKIVVLGWNLGFVLGVLVGCGITRQVSLYSILGVVELVW